ncbi:trehalose-phosphatase [Phenylobacterium sp.]|uniref:trehalose-phosphatase n=1 Tax=Phenylobacterium sp. TaxID=1871053 RepID=UPI00301D6E14
MRFVIPDGTAMLPDMLIDTLPKPGPLALGDTALFLDLDGTIAPIADRPGDVGPDPRRTRLLERLDAGLCGRLAVVSGRTLPEIDAILEGKVAWAAAVHGLVRRGAGRAVLEVPAHPELPAVRARLRAFAAGADGLIVEEKGASVALHYRLAPACAAEARRLARDLAAETGLTIQEGDMVAELRTPGPTKGDAVRAFMAMGAFAGATPVFVGDDVTDEHGFAEVRRLGGYGVLVGAPRATAATFGLHDVDEVLAWLEAAR